MGEKGLGTLRNIPFDALVLVLHHAGLEDAVTCASLNKLWGGMFNLEEFWLVLVGLRGQGAALYRAVGGASRQKGVDGQARVLEEGVLRKVRLRGGANMFRSVKLMKIKKGLVVRADLTVCNSKKRLPSADLSDPTMKPAHGFYSFMTEPFHVPLFGYKFDEKALVPKYSVNRFARFLGSLYSKGPLLGAHWHLREGQRRGPHRGLQGNVHEAV